MNKVTESQRKELAGNTYIQALWDIDLGIEIVYSEIIVQNRCHVLNFRVRLTNGDRKKIETPWSCGYMYPGIKVDEYTMHEHDQIGYVPRPGSELARLKNWKPDPATVLASLLMDVSMATDRTARDFCEEFGYVDDDGNILQKGIRLYLTIQDTEHDLRDLLGWTVFNKLRALDPEDIDNATYEINRLRNKRIKYSEIIEATKEHGGDNE